MVKCRKFRKPDIGQIETWLSSRHLSPPSMTALAAMLPKNGFIVPGVAVGFVYLTDSCIAFLDYFVANPEASKDERNVALDLITQAILVEAKKQGCTVAHCNSRIGAIVHRAKNFGFKEIGQFTSLVRDL